MCQAFAHLFIICRAQWIQNIQSHTNLIANRYHRHRPQNTENDVQRRKKKEERKPKLDAPVLNWGSARWNHWYVNENIREKLNSKPFYKVALTLKAWREIRKKRTAITLWKYHIDVSNIEGANGVSNENGKMRRKYGCWINIHLIFTFDAFI